MTNVRPYKTLVQEYLLNHSFKELEEDYGVKARLSDDCRKVSLNYDQLAVRNSDKLSQQCRGLILGADEGYKFNLDSVHAVGHTIVMARPFDRFFNLGQVEAAEVDFNSKSVHFQEKEDGTCTIVYYDRFQGRWHVATRAVPEANLEIDGFGHHTFRSLFEKALKEVTGFDSLDAWANEHGLGQSNTYVFELCTPENKIVVQHDDYKLYLLGIRANEDGNEFFVGDFEDGMFCDIPVVRSYKLNSLKDMTDFVHGRDPLSFEGIVAVDSFTFNRVKVKNAGYVALGRVKDSALRSPRGLVQFALMEKLDDVYPVLPDFAIEQAKTIETNLREIVRHADQEYKEIRKLADSLHTYGEHEHRKAFAIEAQKRNRKLMPFYMDVYQGKVTNIREWFDSKKILDGSWSNGFLDMVYNLLK